MDLQTARIEALEHEILRLKQKVEFLEAQLEVNNKLIEQNLFI
jgi:hypothetical protein